MTPARTFAEWEARARVPERVPVYIGRPTLRLWNIGTFVICRFAVLLSTLSFWRPS